MSEIKVSRRLVKSPPELWAEVSDAESLARRLGELGEIRIARLEPETTVAWEGEHACGTVAIEGSGWGTAVTIRAEPTLAESEEPVAETPGPPGPGPGPDPTPGPPVPAPDPEPPSPAPPAPGPGPEPPSPGPEPGPPGPPAPGPQMEAPAEQANPPRRGLFARLFPRRSTTEPAVPEAGVADPAPEAEVPGPDPAPLPDPDPLPTPDPEPLPTPSAPEPLPEPAPLPEPDLPAAITAPPEPSPAPAGPSESDIRAVLERMLDDLGAAHHRPFSRG